jgi:hypothetical protein
VPSELLSFHHKEKLHARLKAIPTFLSEYSFANLYLFRKAHDLHLVSDNQDLWITGKTYNDHSFVMPTQDIRSQSIDSLLKFAHNYDFIFPIPEEWLSAFDPTQVSIEFNEGDSDYIYATEKVATFKGPKMHGKKNLLNQFLSLYTPDAKPLTKERMADARDVLDGWQADMAEPKSENDHDACLEAFELCDELVLCGGIYYVNQEPAGFIIGEEFNQTMFTLHFAKGKRKFKGIYQYMFNHFTKMLPHQYTYLNLEQDLGKLALKIAKSSYHPDQMLKKYRVHALPLKD